jgi:tRNA A-37 threonylcarbamoyl transferase component Bud32
MNISPFVAFRKTTNALYTVRDAGAEYFVKCHHGPGGPRRKDREQQIMRLWEKEGFEVPRIHDIEIPVLPKPYLVTDLVKGVSLRECLADNAHPTSVKMDFLTKLFMELRRRHELAIARNDPRLIHPDASTGNILCTKSGFCFIDFEASPRRRDSVMEAAGIEIATLCRWIARDLGVGGLSAILARVLAAYEGREQVLDLAAGRTMNRPFQFYHRWRDKRRKQQNPGEVTKYDIAGALMALRSRSHGGKATSAGGTSQNHNTGANREASTRWPS